MTKFFLLPLLCLVHASVPSQNVDADTDEDVINIATNANLLPHVAEPVVKKKHPPVYDPAKSNHFRPDESLSFAQVLYEDFDMTYADGAELMGYVGHDVVQLGRYFAVTKFGGIINCTDPHFNGVDGILGLGLPAAASKAVPQPLFFAITDMYGGNYANDRILKRPKFTMFSSDDGAELQLGGTDPDCLDASMIYMQSTSITNYALEVESLSFGGIELIQFNHMSSRRSLPAVLDSGTSCLVIPNSTFGGHLLSSPYENFMKNQRPGLSFYITVQGHLFEIPYRHWFRSAINQACVEPSPKNFFGLLLGDVAFRSLVVEFDLTNPEKPLLGLAPPNPNYKPLKPGDEDTEEREISKLPMVKHTRDGIEVTGPKKSTRKRHSVDNIPVLVDPAQTVYFVNVSIGTPRQTFTVFMDTGSSVFAVFAEPPEQETNIRIPEAVHHRIKSNELNMGFDSESMKNQVQKYASKFSSQMRRRIQRYAPHHQHELHRQKVKSKDIENPIHFLQESVQVFPKSSESVHAAGAVFLVAVALFAAALAVVLLSHRRRSLN